MEPTPAVDRALALCRQRAQQAGLHSITGVDLLLALLEDEEGRAAALLLRGGLRVEDARSCLNALIHEKLRLPVVEAVLGRASELARELSGERAVGSEHVLWALIENNGDVQSRLEAAGLKKPRIEEWFHATPAAPIMLEEPLDLAESPERVETARILDVNANRAAEALRVIDDYCRFALNDAFLCREIKNLRHDLARALDRINGYTRMAARDTDGDVGTLISVSSETHRESLAHIAEVNWKRLQEALRSLEEYGKLADSGLATAIEQIRYRSYTLEKSILSIGHSRQRLANAKLYALLTGSLCTAALEFVVEEAAAGGVDIVQLREKELDDRELLQRAKNVRRWTRKAGVLFILNDRPDIARLVEADGVHLGQEDLPIQEARRIMGSQALIGISTHDLEQVRQAIRDGASYIGIGPVFPSLTKSFADFPGLDFVRQASAETSLPAFALGGITLDNLSQILGAGARRVAISSPICRADEPRTVASAFRQMLDAAEIS